MSASTETGQQEHQHHPAMADVDERFQRFHADRYAATVRLATAHAGRTAAASPWSPPGLLRVDVRRDRISARLRFMSAFEPAHRYLGAYGLCTTDDPSILLVRVADGSESGRWTLPGGGVEPLEHPDATVAREFTEETGITPTSIGPVLGIYSHVHPAFQTRLGRLFHHIGIVYKVDAAQASAPRPEQGGSTDQCSWFTLHDVAQLPLAALAQWATALTWPERPGSTAEIAGGHP